MGLTDSLMGAAFDPTESEQIETVAREMARMERDLHDAVQAHYQALGVEPPEDLMPMEERVAQVQRLVGASMSGDLWGFFLEEQAPDDLTNTDKARELAGTPKDEWETLVSTWADGLREQLDDADDATDRELADQFARRRFGVGLDTFEQAVVNWSPGRTMQIAVRGPISRDIHRIQAATRSIEAADTDAVDVENDDRE